MPLCGFILSEQNHGPNLFMKKELNMFSNKLDTFYFNHIYDFYQV